MNAAQQVKFRELSRQAEGHVFSEWGTPVGTNIRCACGWSHQVRRQNAMARAQKVYSAKRAHLQSVIDAQPAAAKLNALVRGSK